jgi:hypothetical protein
MEKCILFLVCEDALFFKGIGLGNNPATGTVIAAAAAAATVSGEGGGICPMLFVAFFKKDFLTTMYMDGEEGG